MGLRYYYQLVPVSHSVVPLGGRWVRPRPIIDVTLIGPTDSRLTNALLDTGADDTLFTEDWAAKIGVDLTNAPAGTGTALGMGKIPLRYAEVTFRIADGSEKREWRGWAGFTPARIHYNTLGFAGCLQFFTAAFHGDIEEAELTVNQLYPGT